MSRHLARAGWPAVVLLAAGCSTAPSQRGTAAGDEGPLKEAFAAYQAALKDKDGDRLWGLLSTEAQGDADRAAKKVRDDYARADADAKAKLAKGLGLAGDKVANLTGKEYLMTPRFVGTGKQEEVPGSKFGSASIQGDKANVTYVEPDDDKMELRFVREGGHWKASPAID